jgi:general secretion pathway protein L
MNVDVARTLQPFRVRYAAPLKRRLDEFWSWWSGELLGLLPQEIQDALAQRNQRLFIALDDQVIVVRQGPSASSPEVQRIERNAPEGVGRNLSADARDLVLMLPDDKVLSTPISLPLAAEENLHEVLTFEMDKHTPFSGDKVYFDYVIARRETSTQELTIDLVYSSRDAVDNLVEAVARQGLTPSQVTGRNVAGDELRSVNLLPPERRRNRRKTLHRLNLALAASCVLLLAVAITLPIVQKNAAIGSLESQVEEAAATAREGSNLRDDLEKMADASRFLAAKKQSDVLIVEVVDEISRILPDHTWISRLDVQGAEIQLQGQSSSSSSLIAIVETSDMFENARFRSPVVQVAGTKEDRFHLSADVTRSRSQ